MEDFLSKRLNGKHGHAIIHSFFTFVYLLLLFLLLNFKLFLLFFLIKTCYYLFSYYLFPYLQIQITISVPTIITIDHHHQQCPVDEEALVHSTDIPTALFQRLLFVLLFLLRKVHCSHHHHRIL
jgi:hypothetical protein